VHLDLVLKYQPAFYLCSRVRRDPASLLVASTLSALPWLVTLSRHKEWTFFISGALIALSFLDMYYVAPRLRVRACGEPSIGIRAHSRG